MFDKTIRPQASDLLRESVTSFAQLIPTVYSMSSRAMTPDVPLIPSSTICRKNTGVAVNCFHLILICFALLVCTCSLTPNPTGRIGIFSSSKERSCWCLLLLFDICEFLSLSQVRRKDFKCWKHKCRSLNKAISAAVDSNKITEFLYELWCRRVTGLSILH